ncbi:V-type ATP synthase subunit E [Brucepastera parasyntrophica]|uniref:V-type ATP synthase subunit E n=1 Tax=Brucepastera parasyntrophica TaxID=2880008 RepID=UPI002109B3CD|nr:V-type ATP synthase subunit E [Brucepastera parasyntrophica]ULQ59821.1 V-type ATP synthase subunit E [Brucepastera parasyntrophica]
MDVQLQELLDKIKKDGVETAESQAAEILKNAEAKAKSIVDKAQEEADEIVKNGKASADRDEKAAEAAVKQASRNVLISFRDGILSELDALIKTETAKSYSTDVLKDLIPEVVKAWSTKSGSDDISVLLSPADAEKLDGAFKTLLKNEIAKGLEIRTDDSVEGGFHIGTKDGAAYYDFSAEAVSELFASYLNPRVSDIVKSAAKEL